MAASPSPSPSPPHPAPHKRGPALTIETAGRLVKATTLESQQQQHIPPSFSSTTARLSPLSASANVGAGRAGGAATTRSRPASPLLTLATRASPVLEGLDCEGRQQEEYRRDPSLSYGMMSSTRSNDTERNSTGPTEYLHLHGERRSSHHDDRTSSSTTSSSSRAPHSEVHQHHRSYSTSSNPRASVLSAGADGHVISRPTSANSLHRLHPPASCSSSSPSPSRATSPVLVVPESGTRPPSRRSASASRLANTSTPVLPSRSTHPSYTDGGNNGTYDTALYLNHASSYVSSTSPQSSSSTSLLADTRHPTRDDHYAGRQTRSQQHHYPYHPSTSLRPSSSHPSPSSLLRRVHRIALLGCSRTDWIDSKTGSYKIPEKLRAYVPLLVWVLVSVAMAVVVGVWHTEVFAALDSLSVYLKSQGFFGRFVLYLCIFITTFPPLPLYSTFIILSGYSFGLWEGFLVSYTAALSGAVVVFLLSKVFLKKSMQRLLDRSKGMKKVLRAIEKRPKLLWLIRVSPYPYNVMNVLLASSSTLSFSCYFWCTALALPKLIIHCSVGTTIRNFAETATTETDEGASEAERSGQRLKATAGAVGVGLCVVVFLYILYVARKAVDNELDDDGDVDSGSTIRHRLPSFDSDIDSASKGHGAFHSPLHDQQEMSEVLVGGAAAGPRHSLSSGVRRSLAYEGEDDASASSGNHKNGRGRPSGTTHQRHVFERQDSSLSFLFPASTDPNSSAAITSSTTANKPGLAQRSSSLPPYSPPSSTTWDAVNLFDSDTEDRHGEGGRKDQEEGVVMRLERVAQQQKQPNRR